MRELEQQLQDIFDRRKNEYRQVFDSNNSIEAKAKNAENYNRINSELVDELIEHSNIYVNRNNLTSNVEVEDMIKEKVIKFAQVFINPIN